MTIAAITNGFHPSGEVVLEFKDVELGFDQHLVLRGISFRLHRGETKVLFGVAGSGKSVILKQNFRFSADRKSTRLNSSHVEISYAVFCLKKKNKKNK